MKQIKQIAWRIKRPVSDDVLSHFCGQLATMLDAGIKITDALITIASEEKDTYFANAILTVAKHIEQGNELATSLSKESTCFSPFMVAMCHVGEKAGRLPKILYDLEAYFERCAAHRAHLMTVFLYPAIVFILTSGVTIYLVKKVMPILLDSLDAMDRQMPPGARILFILNNVMTTIIPIILLVVIAFYLLEKFYPKDTRLAEKLSQLKLKLPIVGKLLYHREMALFSDALGVMAASGVNLLTAVPVVCALLQNVWLKKRLGVVTNHISEGQTLSESFKETQAVDPSFCQIIEVGEKSGTLDQNLVKGRAYYQKAYDKQFKLLSAFLEPAVLIIVGIMVGLVVLGFMSILYAIYNGYASFL